VPRPALSRLTVLWWVTGPLVVALLAAVLWVAVRPVPYYSMSPGLARSVEPLVTITSGADGPELHREPVRDDLLFLTVTIRQPFGAEAMVSLADEHVELVQSQIIDGTQTREQNRRFNRALMTSAKDKAAKVALERAGFEVGVSTDGAVIIDTGPSYPVAEVLFPGDTVVAADGGEVRSVDDLVGAIATHAPGDTIELGVLALADGGQRTVDVELVARPDDPAVAMLGVTLENRPVYDFPVDVTIDSGSVMGSSAGLAFALAILDRITPGMLTGGQRVAVTGTIELDSSVGPIGGVRQKTEAAVRAGASLMLVPEMEYDEAVEAAGGRIDVHSVSTFEDALDALVAAGGDPVPKDVALEPAVPVGS
jgi:PDZ domain-containing protein